MKKGWGVVQGVECEALSSNQKRKENSRILLIYFGICQELWTIDKNVDIFISIWVMQVGFIMTFLYMFTT
jgi:hypothetical protein